MELIEMFCDLLLARFGLIEHQKSPDDGLKTAIATLIWVTPRMQADVGELKVISDVFAAKYSKEFAQIHVEDREHAVSDKVKRKLACQEPNKELVEQYLKEIAKSFGIEYIPSLDLFDDNMFDDFGASDHNKGNMGGGGSGGYAPPIGFTYPQPADMSNNHPGYPPISAPEKSGLPPSGGYSTGLVYPAPVNFNEKAPLPFGGNQQFVPPPQYTSMDINDIRQPPYVPTNFNHMTLPDLPEIPMTPAGTANTGENSVDNNDEFNDLTKRFEELKKRK